MPSKRKYLSDDESDDFCDDDYLLSEDEIPKPRPTKRARHRGVQASTVETSPASASKKPQRKDRRASAGTKSHRRATASKTAAEDRLATKLAAELADLVENNDAPPKVRIEENSSDEDLPPRRPTSKRKDENPHEMGKPPKSRKTIAPLPKPKSKRTAAERLRDEVAELLPWAHWDSGSEEEAYSSSDSEDDEAEWTPSHSGKYPPAKAVVQSVPWLSLPPEIRNEIYQYCMANEEKKVVNVFHCPDGIPRRSGRGGCSATNFSQSYWGFTQTCMAVRQEFTPWLLAKRSVRTLLATLNKYVDVFHRRDLVTKQRAGKVEPICNDGPLPGQGVEILELIREKTRSPDFHLRLRSNFLLPETPFSPLWNQEFHFDELDVFNELKKHHEITHSLASIHMTSTSHPRELVEDGSYDELGNVRIQ